MSAWAPIVKAMPRSDAEEIYRRKYAVAVRFDQLPSGVDVVMFDYGVNSGPARAIRVVRRLLNLPAGSVLDTATITAIQKSNATSLIRAINAERLSFMRSIRKGAMWAKFGRGWKSRVDDLTQYAVAIVNKTTPAPAPDLSTVPTPKARHEAPGAGANTAGTTTTTVGAAGGAYVAGVNVWVILAIIAVFAGLGYAYYLWKKRVARLADETVTVPPGTVVVQRAV